MQSDIRLNKMASGSVFARMIPYVLPVNKPTHPALDSRVELEVEAELVLEGLDEERGAAVVAAAADGAHDAAAAAANVEFPRGDAAAGPPGLHGVDDLVVAGAQVAHQLLVLLVVAQEALHLSCNAIREQLRQTLTTEKRLLFGTRDVPRSERHDTSVQWDFGPLSGDT